MATMTVKTTTKNSRHYRGDTKQVVVTLANGKTVEIDLLMYGESDLHVVVGTPARPSEISVSRFAGHTVGQSDVVSIAVETSPQSIVWKVDGGTCYAPRPRQ